MARKKKISPEEQDSRDNGFYNSNIGPMPEDDQPARQMTADGTPVEYKEDGTIEVALDDAEDTTADAPVVSEFDSNLADNLTQSEQINLGTRLKEYVDVDLASRASWSQRMVDGLQIIGLEDVPEDAVAFEGAARVTHPGIAEAMVQFQARSMEEMMPATGPVKCGVIGESSEELEARAQRVEDYMNYQFMEEDDEYYNEVDDMLLALPYFGSTFKKIAPDPQTKCTRSRYISPEDFIVPYHAKSLQTATRYTHRFTMSHNGFKRAVASGYFIDADFMPNLRAAGDSDAKRIKDKSDDRTESAHADDHILTFYEMHCEEEFEWETEGAGNKYKLPYAITFEEETGRVVRVTRLWDESDETCKKEVWFVHYKFLPGFGFYGLGYLHLIGGLGRAASGAVRLLLDGSMTSSLQGGFKSRDARISSDQTFSPATWIDVDMSYEELSKSFYSPPFKEPSPALFKTLELMVQGVERFTSTTEAMVGEASNTGPVGTTVALIEQGSKIFSGIHKRLHAAARKEFKLVAKSNYLFMAPDAEYPFAVAGGAQSSFAEDFDPKTVDIAPVSDPNIFSSVQRIALAQAVNQMVDADQAGDFSKRDRVRAKRALLKALRVPDHDKYFKSVDVQRMDPVSENEAFLHGTPVQVFREQDDAAHLQLHQSFLQQVMQIDPQIQTQAVPAIQAHIAAHYGQAYRKTIEQQLQQAAGVGLPPYDPNNPEENPELSAEIENQVSMLLAQVIPPAAPPQQQQDPEAQKDIEATAKSKRDDMLAQRAADREDEKAKRDEARKDAQKGAELKRDGFIDDGGLGV